MVGGMSSQTRILLATVCLERNRWSSKQPSFAISDWHQRILSDGFDGIELWENHHLLASAAEQGRQVELASPLAVFNTYAGFGDGDGEAVQRERAAAAVARLDAKAVKYNLGREADGLEVYRKNLLAWAELLPAECRLLCECHPGTVLEELDAAVAFFADLDPGRFGVIAHLSGDADGLAKWLDAFGSRVQHLHYQKRQPVSEADAGPWADAAAAVKDHGFRGSVAIEFTRGIGKDEQIETLYASAREDMAWCRAALA
jgi:hypothetical protein